MKIQKNRSIKIQISSLISFAIGFLSSFCFALGREYTWQIILCFLAGTVFLLFIVWLLCLLLIKNEKQYFIFEKDQITLSQGEKILCELKKVDMIELKYNRFFWAFLMQMGSGYLQISCHIEALPDKKFASIILPNDTAIFEISMSLTQAKEVSKILGRNITIK